MKRYDLRCPSAAWNNHSYYNAMDAYDAALLLSEDEGYVQILVNGVVVAEFNEGRRQH
ncbi:MAG: hypothetical protein O3A14_19030 [Cyanobacteria bacterium]|nr:hypothetical protein [Cyanobacteriota bacterium]